MHPKKFGPFTIEGTEAFADELQQGLTEYTLDCMNSIDSGKPFTTLSGEPYCGCPTCDVRETLAYVVPRVLYAQSIGLVRFVSVEMPPRCNVTRLTSGPCVLPMSHMGFHRDDLGKAWS